MKTIQLIKRSALLFFVFGTVGTGSMNAQIEVNAAGNVDIKGTTTAKGITATEINSTIYGISATSTSTISSITANNTGSGIAVTISTAHSGQPLIHGRYYNSPYSNAFAVTNLGNVYAYDYISLSDKRFKQNIAKIESPLDKLLQLRGVTFQYKPIDGNETLDVTKEEAELLSKHYSTQRIGLIAQEVEQVLPGLVQTTDDGRKGIAYGNLVGLLVEAVKEQQQMIENQQKQIDELKGIQLRSSTSDEETTGIQSASGDIATKSQLYQNAPNPFTENTEIRFSLPENAKQAYICIFDLQGTMLKKSANLVGQSNLLIQGKEFKAGMYLYSLIVDGKETDTKRMILTK